MRRMESAKISTEGIELIRTAIQRTFIERCKKNPSYSLRAYSNYLEVDQSNLSKILRGQKGFSLDFAKSVSLKLGIKPSDLKAIFSEGTRAMPGFLAISDDELELISEWYHFAILELAKTEGFEYDERAIANRLMIHIEEVRAAVARLERLGFAQLADGRLKVLTPNTTWSNTKETSVARRQYQRKLIEKSLDAIDHVPFERRYNGSHTVAINPDRLPEFKEKLETMREELAEFLQADGESNLTEVYQYTFALFPLTKQASGDSK